MNIITLFVLIITTTFSLQAEENHAVDTGLLCRDNSQCVSHLCIFGQCSDIISNNIKKGQLIKKGKLEALYKFNNRKFTNELEKTESLDGKRLEIKVKNVKQGVNVHYTNDASLDANKTNSGNRLQGFTSDDSLKNPIGVTMSLKKISVKSNSKPLSKLRVHLPSICNYQEDKMSDNSLCNVMNQKPSQEKSDVLVQISGDVNAQSNQDDHSSIRHNLHASLSKSFQVASDGMTNEPINNRPNLDSEHVQRSRNNELIGMIQQQNSLRMRLTNPRKNFKSLDDESRTRGRFYIKMNNNDNSFKFVNLPQPSTILPPREIAFEIRRNTDALEESEDTGER